jgi:peroxiredoxin 2/4
MSEVTASGFVVSDLGASVGDKAPPFSLPCTRNVDAFDESVALTDFRGRWLILLFYPLDFSAVSHSELLSFDGRYEELSARNTELLAISTDSVYAHRTWVSLPRDRGGLFGLSFPLASDTTHAVSNAYGALVEEKGYAQRSTFIVDPKGIVRYSVTHDVSVGRSIDETLRVLGALAEGQPTFADWQPSFRPHG